MTLFMKKDKIHTLVLHKFSSVLKNSTSLQCYPFVRVPRGFSDLHPWVEKTPGGEALDPMFGYRDTAEG